MIQSKISQEIASFITNFINENNISVYDEKSLKGLFRHIVIKYGMKTDEVMCVLVLSSEKFKEEKELVHKLLARFKNIKSIVKNVNSKNTNVIFGDTNVVLYGKDYIQDKLGGFLFNISANSFYQVNPVQTEKLYSIAVQAANVNKADTVFDLYSRNWNNWYFCIFVCRKSIWN